MTAPSIHLVAVGDRQNDPCHRCGRTIHSMNPLDGFTLDPADATCEVHA